MKILGRRDGKITISDKISYGEGYGLQREENGTTLGQWYHGPATWAGIPARLVTRRSFYQCNQRIDERAWEIQIDGEWVSLKEQVFAGRSNEFPILASVPESAVPSQMDLF